MPPTTQSLDNQVALITGAARRIGADIARYLHSFGMNIIIHFHHSHNEALILKQELESQRPNSVLLLQADLLNIQTIPELITKVQNWQQRLDLLINNASSFYPTPIATCNELQWDELMGANLKAPFFLAQNAAPLLRNTHGSIINLVDIHARRPLLKFPIYSIAKAGNAMLVKALARELAPEIRVNGIAPGVILWAMTEAQDKTQQSILKRIPLQQIGTTADIARAVLFLHRDANYITGHIITVDGGRTIQQ